MLYEDELRRLEQRIAQLQSTLVAYSGGVDSAFLAYVAHRVLRQKMRAVIADSPSLARAQLADAVGFAQEHRIPLRVVQTEELERDAYARNDGSRCFHCKDELFTVLEEIRRQCGFAHIAYGMNVDDGSDFRPGQKAAQRHGVIAPLAESGLTKAMIRELARQAGLRIWNKPASPCLSSRIEYGRTVTRKALHQVEQAEELLRSIGFSDLRVRHHGQLARIEVPVSEIQRLLDREVVERIVRQLKALGFTYVAVDLEGLRSGSMNDLLPLAELTKTAQ